MTHSTPPRTYTLAGRTVNRMGYGAMQLAGPGVFGPPKHRAEAVAVLREALALALALGVTQMLLRYRQAVSR